jgi:hypothetical protein
MSALARGITHTTWLWPSIESLHVISLVVLAASIATFDLRLMGVAFRRVRVSDMSARLMPLTWGAFGMMILTGSLLFTPFAQNYCFNSSFQIKMFLIVLAGVNMTVFQLTVYRKVVSWDADANPPALARVAGILSVVIWMSVIAAGRLIGFVT